MVNMFYGVLFCGKASSTTLLHTIFLWYIVLLWPVGHCMTVYHKKYSRAYGALLM